MALSESEEFELLSLERQRGGGPQASGPKGLGAKAWQLLGKPEQLSRKGLQQLASYVPQPAMKGKSMVRDVGVNLPHMAAETMAEAAPGFVSRGALMTGAASPFLRGLGKVAAPLGRAMAGGLEDWSGIRPAGALTEAAKDPTLLFAKGSKSAQGLYQAAQKELPYEQTIFKGLTRPHDIVDKAVKIVDKGGKLEPQEGLIARKALDKVKNRLSSDAFSYYRGIFDKIAKESSDIAQADPQFRRGLMAQSLRGLLPKNVGGRASPFKVGEALALRHLGPLGKAATALFSPLALGTGATGLGVAGRMAANPQSAMAVQQLIQRLIGQNAGSNP